MVLIYGDQEYPVKNATKPRKSNRRGQTWESYSNFVNDEPVSFYIDTTWGFYSYFQVAGKWYRIGISDVDVTQCREQKFELRRKVNKLSLKKDTV